MKVENKVAIVTGASSGFGKDLSIRLVSKGAKVILADIDQAEGVRFEKELNNGRKEKVAVFVSCDVTKNDQLAALFTAGEKHFGGVDIVINNAGIAENCPIWEDKKGVWKKVIDIDLVAVIEGTRLGIEYLTKQGRGGVIVNTASLAGLYPQVRTPAYSAAKFGVIGFTRSFKDFPDESIRINAVAPGFSPTKIIESIREVVEAVGPLVPVESVTDAFMMLIEDDSYKGDVARITAQYGINVIGRPVPGSKKSKSKL